MPFLHKRMMQERELLPEFAVKEYFLHIFGKDLEEVVESLLVTRLLPVLLIALNTKLVTATMNKALTSAASILDMWTIAFFLPRVETTETLKKFLDHGDDGDDSDMCVCFRRWAMFHKETKKKQMNHKRIDTHLIPKTVKKLKMNNKGWTGRDERDKGGAHGRQRGRETLTRTGG